MTNEPEAPTGLGPLEDSIMELLWARGAGTVGWVVEHLERHKPPAYTTVMTVMGRLTTKGLLERRTQGRAYIYQPAKTKEEFIADSSRTHVRALVRDFGDLALAHFAQELERADPEKLERLRTFLEADERNAH
jgi:predicted transcriptional regulator